MDLNLGGLDYAIIALYLLGMMVLGGVLTTRIKGFKDYFLAGGALTTPLLVCTLVSTYYGLDVTFGTSESGFYYGLSAWFWYSVPYYVFILIAATILAHRLRRYRFMTLPDVLEHHYGPAARVIGSIACLVYSMPILAMFGMMTLLKMLGFELYAGMAITIGVCAIYTAMGGLWADTISDTIQFVLMCVSLAIALPMAVEWVGGYSFVNDLEPKMTHVDGGLSWWMLAAWSVGGLTVLVEPAFYQRVFAAESAKSITRALLIGILLWAAYDWGVVLIGMVAQAAVKQGKLPDSLAGNEALLAVCMKMLPLGLRGLFIGGILAAAMSTIDSYSLLASGNLVYDIYSRLLKRPLSDKTLILLTRIGVLTVIVIATLVALLFDRMRTAWLFMASALTAVVLVPVIAALYVKRPKPAAGLAAAAAGLLGLVAFYSVLFALGEYDDDIESTVLRIGPVELWQEGAALFALPVSVLGFILGQTLGAKPPYEHNPAEYRPENDEGDADTADTEPTP
ncbi:MAG: hypothetical protein GC159_16560 [Phycisphaera sp.]|nr:hypothetical protein [Phycisphaera sp.]